MAPCSRVLSRHPCEPEFQLSHWTSVFCLPHSPLGVCSWKSSAYFPSRWISTLSFWGDIPIVQFLTSQACLHLPWFDSHSPTLQRLLLPLLHSVAVNMHRSALLSSPHHASPHFYLLFMMFPFHTAPSHCSPLLGFISGVSCPTSFSLQFFRVAWIGRGSREDHLGKHEVITNRAYVNPLVEYHLQKWP